MGPHVVNQIEPEEEREIDAWPSIYHPWSFGLLLTLGCAALTAICWLHSWPSLSQGRLFPGLGSSPSARPALEVLQAVTVSWLFALYVLGLTKWRRFSFTTRTLALMMIAPGLLVLSALPVNSNDLLHYVSYGRIVGIYGANPYVHPYSDFAESFSPYVVWDLPMPYGPAVLPAFIIAGWLSQQSVLLSIFALKSFWLVTHVFNCVVLHWILKRGRVDPAYGLFLFAFNPLILVELIGNGHNDGLMILFFLLGLAALQRQQLAAALMLTMMSAFVKTPGLIFWAATLVYAVRRGEWRGAALGVAGSTGMVALAFAALFPSLDSALVPAFASWYTENSLHTLLIDFLTQPGGAWGGPDGFGKVFTADRQVSSLLFLCFCLWRSWHITDPDSLVRELAYLLLALLIAYNPWFWPWYVTWLIPLTAISESVHLRWAIITFSWTALTLYAFPYYVVEVAPLHQLWAALRILIVHVVPLAVMLVLWLANRVRATSAAGGAVTHSA